MVALALDRERLAVALRASRERLRASRARIVGAADEERRRIARDLHDGLLTRLIVLAIKVRRVSAQAADGARVDADELHAGLQSAIAELRELVHGVMPAALTERGLYAAVEELADSMPIPTRLELDRTRAPLPAPGESACYFLVSEAFTNAVKHSRARELQLRIGRSNDRLQIEVADDGVGGARNAAGTGLRGIADRIEALGSHLRLDSPAGGGTCSSAAPSATSASAPGRRSQTVASTSSKACPDHGGSSRSRRRQSAGYLISCSDRAAATIARSV